MAEFRDWSMRKRDRLRELAYEREARSGDERTVQKLQRDASDLEEKISASFYDEIFVEERAAEVETQAEQAQMVAAVELERLFVEQQLFEWPSADFPRTEWDDRFEEKYNVEPGEDPEIVAAELDKMHEPESEPDHQARREALSAPVEQKPPSPDPELIAMTEAKRFLSHAKYVFSRAQADFDNRLSVEDAETRAFRSLDAEDLPPEDTYDDPDVRQLMHERKLTRALSEAEEALYQAKVRARDLGIETMSEVRYMPPDVGGISAMAGDEVIKSRDFAAPWISDWTTIPDEADVTASKESEEHQIAELESYRTDDADLDKVDHPAGPGDSASQVAEMGDRRRWLALWSSYTDELRAVGHEDGQTVPLPMGI